MFDSSGPEGKVRGTPQQIIEKYNQLARDALLANDRVATENFQQHSEHYTRLLSDAQREAEARREQQEAMNRERQREREEARAQAQQEASIAQPETIQPAVVAESPSDAVAAPMAEPEPVIVQEPAEGLGDVVDLNSETDSGLVETPESKPKKPRRPRKPRAPAKDVAAAEDPAPAPKDTPEAGSEAPPEPETPAPSSSAAE